ncbi:MAG: glycoside hydrolase family 31 protein [Kiritimatiellia bacterium]|nr:glycoside hydrolase family 31 protein [Kiritimatiellia bacterium]
MRTFLNETFFAAALFATVCAGGSTLKVQLLPGEGWHGGATTFGRQAPYGLKSGTVVFDIRRDNYSNGAVPFLVSTKGRTIWSDKAFSVSLKNGTMTLEGDAPIELSQSGKNLREAFLAAAKAHFPPSGKLPDRALFEKPQWNTWVELTYNQNQKDILAYARAVAANGFPQGGVLMIDDTWQYGYGIWEFDPRRFPNPKAMVDELHSLGFKVMLWVCPFVSMDSPGYREMAFGMLDAGKRVPAGGLICQYKNDPKPVNWWNGKSADIDFTHPLGAAWFARQLKRLQTDFGVDGFKLDAGDIHQYAKPYLTHKPAEPYELCEAYAAIGLQFPLNEYRACYRHAGEPIVLRLCDKDHSWAAVQQLVPDILQSGLMGYPFVCPDMIGSGSWLAFAPDAPTPYDPELFVRSAQVHALTAMMQFSAAPWRMLKGEHLDAVRSAAALRMKFTPYILSVAEASAKSGEPMVRSMEYQFPGHGWEQVTDQFLMGDDLLVAPQTVKGAAARAVAIPPGKWRADDGTVYSGPATVSVKTPLSRLPYFERVR